MLYMSNEVILGACVLPLHFWKFKDFVDKLRGKSKIMLNPQGGSGKPIQQG